MVYKTIIIIFILVLNGCVITHSPSQDVVIQINLTIQGKPTNIVLPFEIEKGYLDKKYEGTHWITKEKFEELQKNEGQKFNSKNREVNNQ